MVPQAQLVLMARRVNLVPLVLLELLEPAVLLVTVVRMVPLALLDLLVPLVLMVSLVLKESKEKVDRREMQVPPAHRVLLELLAHRAQLACPDLKVPVVPRDLL